VECLATIDRWFHSLVSDIYIYDYSIEDMEDRNRWRAPTLLQDLNSGFFPTFSIREACIFQ
jgi:hypothetical protein